MIQDARSASAVDALVDVICSLESWKYDYARAVVLEQIYRVVNGNGTKDRDRAEAIQDFTAGAGRAEYSLVVARIISIFSKYKSKDEVDELKRKLNLALNDYFKGRG